MKNKAILIVAGEPNSIFLEIFFKSLKKNNFKKPIVLIASKNLVAQQMKKLRFNFKINLIDTKKIVLNLLTNKELNIINVDYKFKKVFDKISESSNLYIKNCFDIALTLLKTNKFIGLINGPISKKTFLKDKFFGMTEFFANKTEVKKNKFAMLIYNKRLSVSPLTTHIALKEVHKSITKNKIIDLVLLINEFYKKKLKKKPKIAITGLNPHCESNYKTSEEERIIKPAIKYLRRKKINSFGPFPADTIFLKEVSKKYDVVVGMYHDQVLTPLKTLFGFDAINITLGLPFIRISPDHGPNEKMIGKNRSNPQSLVQAIKFLDK
ncbi:MAG: 4-hydroxythreonine-4-phosphate dehydrogenase PdxA [Candidatus Pelagibacter bacterium]|nr:4-hydroxythreonine-4-phosphate dehydrogenase PdxA [Candidatus Pelagibacter bacterium]